MAGKSHLKVVVSYGNIRVIFLEKSPLVYHLKHLTSFQFTNPLLGACCVPGTVLRAVDSQRNETRSACWAAYLYLCSLAFLSSL